MVVAAPQVIVAAVADDGASAEINTASAVADRSRAEVFALRMNRLAAELGWKPLELLQETGGGLVFISW